MSSICAYNGNEPYIFVSYSHKDNATVLPIVTKMQADGYRVWFDAGIHGGEKYDRTIAEKIRGCDHFIAVLSENYLDSAYCHTELFYAIRQGKHILPIYLENVTLPPEMDMHLSSLHWIAKYMLRSEDEFYQVLYQSDGINAFRSATQHAPANPALQTKTITYTNGTYTGTVNAAGERHGCGTYHWSSGDTYEGDFRNNKRTGHGIYRWADGTVYEGAFLDGKITGYGTKRWTNGTVYEGEWLNDNRHGRGTQRWGKDTDYKDDVYEGDWLNDKRTGRGTYRWADGTVYEGAFLDGKITGYGTKHWTDGDVYEGDFRDDNRHGRGTYRWANGAVYEGDFRDNKRTGRGTYRWTDGTVYEGAFLDGKITGYGTMRRPNGTVQKGQWKDGQFIG